MRTRIAPSPTGALHLGNARTFLVNWALARQRGWRIVLRIEDLDGPRIKPGAGAEAIELLAWLGIDWDEGPFFQLCDLQPYQEALAQLARDGRIYACRCTRRQIEEASLSAPHGEKHELRYSGACRPEPLSPTEFTTSAKGQSAWRVRVPDGPTYFNDNFAGQHAYNVQATTGDFLVATKQGLPSYQLAVVVDDARQAVDCIVRGDDLLGSTHRQQLLQRMLDVSTPGSYWHLPLVIGEDGRRLAKRHGDSRISHYRAEGVRAQRVVGLLAEWCGQGSRREIDAVEFLDEFDLQRIPRTPAVFASADDAWLLAGAAG
jgi:glutamyl-tRNA synthetase